MIPRQLFSLLRCPSCFGRQLYVTAEAVCCAGCRASYPVCEGYLDLMPREVRFDYVSKYVAEEEHMAEELDYRDVAPPLLAAGVRNRQLRRMLRLSPSDVVLDNGCGNGRFAVWNQESAGLMVGSDPATMYADEALRSVALAQADSRRLPFADDSFDKSFSVDVLEHFPMDVISDYLGETARVLRPGGYFLAFSNTRERSPIQPLIDLSKRLGRWFVSRGLYDFDREARRKSDHVKALETWDEVEAALRQAGLEPVRVVFWNSLFTSFVEHVLMKLGEVVLARARGLGAARPPLAQGAGPQRAHEHAESGAGAAGEGGQRGTEREIVARRRIRGHLRPSSPVYWALFAVTLLMELDLWLFGWMRTGPYFVLARKPLRLVAADPHKVTLPGQAGVAQPASELQG